MPGPTNHGTLQGGAVEDSNVDLTSELVTANNLPVIGNSAPLRCRFRQARK